MKQLPPLTKTQKKLFNILQDGQPHSKWELMECLDELSSQGNLRVHICLLRKKVKKIGNDLICVYHNGRFYYRYVGIIQADRQ